MQKTSAAHAWCRMNWRLSSETGKSNDIAKMCSFKQNAAEELHFMIHTNQWFICFVHYQRSNSDQIVETIYLKGGSIMNKRFLTFDYGASSGRGILADFDGQRLSVREIHRFVNEQEKL